MSLEIVQPKRLKGFRDQFPQTMAKRLRILNTVRQVAKVYGFQEMATPALEYAEILLGKGGEENDKQVYRFTDHGNREVALRFDLTVPFARFVAEHQGELTFPFKRLQVGEVWRGENTQKGRYREFTQCDLDIIGSTGLIADFEILSCFWSILSQLPIGPFEMKLSSRAVLSALIQHFFPTASLEATHQILISIDKLPKIGAEETLRLVENSVGNDVKNADSFLQLISTPFSSVERFQESLAPFLHKNTAGISGLERLVDVVTLHKKVHGENSKGSLKVDLTITRGLGYYTGIVFESFLKDLPGFGSICSGGRYNDLASRFTRNQLPGIGASIGLDRLVTGWEELIAAKGEQQEPIAGVYIVLAHGDAKSYALKLSQQLRNANILCEVSLDDAKTGNQIKLAVKKGYSVALIVGDQEEQSKTFALKHLDLGSQESNIPLSQLEEKVCAALSCKS